MTSIDSSARDDKKLIDVDLSVTPTRPEDVIEGMVPQDLSILYGDGGVAKTLLAMAEAHCIVTGTPYLGHAVKQGKVLYIDTEMGGNQIAYRAYQVALGLGRSRPPDGLRVKTLAADNILDAYGELTEAVAAIRPVLVYIDSLGAALGDMDAISATVINPLMTRLQRLKVPWRLVDHQATLQKGEFYTSKTPFGSAFKRHRIRSSWQVQRSDLKLHNALDLILHNHKVTFGPIHEPIGVRVAFDGDAAVISPTPIGASADLLDLFRSGKERVPYVLAEYPGLTAAELSERIGVTKETAHNYLVEEEKDGRAQRVQGAHNDPLRWYPADFDFSNDPSTDTSGSGVGQGSHPKGCVTPLMTPTPSQANDACDAEMTPEMTPASNNKTVLVFRRDEFRKEAS